MKKKMKTIVEFARGSVGRIPRFAYNVIKYFAINA
jgi:hypothetical protein